MPKLFLLLRMSGRVRSQRKQDMQQMFFCILRMPILLVWFSLLRVPNRIHTYFINMQTLLLFNERLSNMLILKLMHSMLRRLLIWSRWQAVCLIQLQFTLDLWSNHCYSDLSYRYYHYCCHHSNKEKESKISVSRVIYKWPTTLNHNSTNFIIRKITITIWTRRIFDTIVIIHKFNVDESLLFASFTNKLPNIFLATFQALITHSPSKRKSRFQVYWDQVYDTTEKIAPWTIRLLDRWYLLQCECCNFYCAPI